MTKRSADTEYIRDEAGLLGLCERLRGHDRLAVDTEFMGEGSSRPRLGVIQVACGDMIAIIDYQKVPGLDPFFSLLDDARILKVLHAGRQDLEIFSVLSGSVPTPVFDTQVAAAMVGYGTQIGYAQLVKQVLKVPLEKSETFTNCAQPPLTPEQIAYALEDVRYLFLLHDHLVRKLKALGRLEWAEEEIRRVQVVAADE